MAQAAISGTFTGTGNSAEWSGQSANIALSFAGTATVNVQVLVSGSTWVTAQSYTASGSYKWDPGASVAARLNCSAHTDNVVYRVAF